MTSQQAVAEAERNVSAKLPAYVRELRRFLARSVSVVTDPTADDIARFSGQADSKDLPILVAAILHNCPRLITFNVRHFTPHASAIVVQRPGDFVALVRAQLSKL